MRKVLIPTDFSLVSKNALKYGLNLYKNTETVFTIIHVYHPSFDPTQPEVLDSSLSMEAVKNESMKNLLATIDDTAKEFNVEVNSIIEIGFTIEKLVKLSSEFDIIIMGSTGSNNFLSKVFGGISSGVVSKAKCPVLLVPQDIKFEIIKNIIYSCDFEGVDSKILDKVILFAERNNSIVHFVHIQSDNRNFNLSVPDGIKIEYTLNIIESSSIKKGLNNYIKNKNAKLVIMATKHRKFWEKFIHKSITREFALRADIPLLIYHEKK